MNGYFVASNRAEGIYSWAGSGNIAAVSTDPKALVILPFGSRLNLYNTVESGTSYRQRIHWSVAGSISDFSGSGSGYVDLVTEFGGDEILAAGQLGSRVAVYGNRHVAFQRYVGGNTVFVIDPVLLDLGIAGSEAFVAFPDFHLFLGTDNIWRLDASGQLTAIGDAIKDDLFDRVDRSRIQLSIAEYNPTTNSVRFHIPTNSTGYMTYFYNYNLTNQTWSSGAYTSADITSVARYCTQRFTTIGEITEKIGDIPWKIGEAVSGLTYPYPVYSSSARGIFKDDPTQIKNYVGHTSEGMLWPYFDTKDFICQDIPDAYLHILEMVMIAKGAAVTIFYSVNFGLSWTSLVTLTLDTSSLKTFHLYFPVTGKAIRLRFINYALAARDIYFNIQSIRLYTKQGSDIL